MIPNDIMVATTQQKHDDIISWIRQSEYEFFMTGSRFFGGIQEDSDIDFFVMFDEDVIKKLNEFGFTCRDMSNRHYCDDPYIEDLYVWGVKQHKETHDIEPNQIIHVQVIKPRHMEKKKFLNAMLKANGVLWRVEHADRKLIWRACYRSIDAYFAAE